MTNQVSESVSQKNDEKLIDVEKAISVKNPKLYKFLPRFILNYIKRTIHQDGLNDAAHRHKNEWGHDFVDATMKEFNITVKCIGTENIPAHGGIIMAANHPLGGLDGIAFIDAVGDYRKDVKFFVNDLLMALKNFDPLFVPVNKHGKNSVDYTKTMEEVYSSDNCIMIFPAGLVSRRQKAGVIEDLVWKKSFITKSVQYKKNILPVYIDARNSDFFYNFAYWRKKIGVKANLEMFFLPDEMYKQKGKTITFTFGKEIPWETFTKEHAPDYWANRVKQHVYALHSGDKKMMLPTI